MSDGAHLWDKKKHLVVTEGVESTWYYHLSEVKDGRETVAICGARVMHTEVPITAWGFVGHLKERWCKACHEGGAL